MECGDSNQYCSFAIERDESTQKPYWVQYLHNDSRVHRTPIADKEAGALKRLGLILKAHPDLCYYHQSDPRGCSLYILRKSDLGAGEEISSVYNRGIAICD